MIAYLKGVLVQKNPAFVLIETSGGVAYRVFISLNTYSKLPTVEGAVRLFTYFQVKEDAHTLYGFADEDERELFEHLISVSGIGSSTAQMMLSALQPNEIRQAIVQENESLIKSIKGIGVKTAKLLILQLKDKLAKTTVALDLPVVGHNNLRDEALNALLALGIAKPMAQKALNKVLTANPNIGSIEALIKQALQVL
ncbi:MAG: Holliday junction branch migration protein RuvA [Sphingobacteriales bacterium]|jgi:Holliday junction DNA helicase RuvA|nr:Holliday junction branch migration protein RuvA [Sphingobacteriales bacterium]MCC7222202.1 Holliday junction branch migration protein RuvA [Chitinophagales bacterium]